MQNGRGIKDTIKGNLIDSLCKWSDGLAVFMARNLKNQVDIMDVDTDFKNGYIELYGTVTDKADLDIYNSTYINIDLKNYEITEVQCQCDGFYNNTKGAKEKIACKHIVATANKFIDEVYSGRIKIPIFDEIKSSLEVKSGEMLLNYLDNKDNKCEKELINIGVALSEGHGEVFEVSFKIGAKKMYVLKNIPQFISAIDEGVPLEFGKGFTYYPDIHYFSKENNNIINFIREYTNLSSIVDNTSNHGYRYGYEGGASRKLVKNKSITLVGFALRRFLEVASHQVIDINLNEVKSKVKIIKDNLPINLNIKEENETIVLENKGLLPIPLDSSSGVFLLDNDLYIPSLEQSEKYSPFINAFSYSKNVVFNKEQAEQVFTKVIPVINTITEDFTLDENIEKKVAIGDLALEFYFDRDKKNTYCNIKTIYGGESFDVLKGYKGDKYIVRDLKGEQSGILNLEAFKFYNNKDRFEFVGKEEELFSFLTTGINELEDIGTVYYSESFKEQKVYKSQSIAASLEEKSGFLNFTFSMGEIDPKEFKNILKAFRNNKKFYKLKNNSFVDLEESISKDFWLMLDNLVGESKLNDNSISIAKNKAIYISDTIEEKDLGFIKGRELVDDIAEKFDTLENVDYSIPKGLRADLREYQIKGYNWFKTLSHYGFGGILADEMGLGKTVQTIAFLLSEKKKRSLIITPTSLIYNWKNEFEKFAPTMNICILHGDKEERLELIKNINEYDVILTTYGTLRNDSSVYENLNFDYCIIDEGQNIKNHLSQSSEAVKEINAKVKFALTGTPIENNLMELWSIFDFVMSGYLYSSKKFQDKFIGQKDKVNMDELKKLIRPFILRRLKKNVMKDLPEKIEKKFFVEMTKEQKKVYAAFVNDIQEKMESEDFTKDKITVFSYLTKLRQLCLDPSIIVEGYTGGSAKVNIAMDIINENIESGNKILLFSQFTSVLSNLKKELDKNNIGYYYLDGSTKAQERIELVSKFNNDNEKMIFLISLKAGGTGLNLTSANVVIHFDPWWNPAIEDQATDRAHRFGQQNVVEVIKLISQGTVEEKIITLQEAKKELINQVMEGEFKEGSFLKNLSDSEIKELFE